MEIRQKHHIDRRGNPEGGYVVGSGLLIYWKEEKTIVDKVIVSEKGVTIEDLLRIIADRIVFLNGSNRPLNDEVKEKVLSIIEDIERIRKSYEPK